MPNAKELDMKGQKKILNYGTAGTGKTTMFLTLPGKKFLYVFDPASLTVIAGHDIDYEAYLPDPQLRIKSRMRKGGGVKGEDRKMAKFRPESFGKFQKHAMEFIGDALEGYDVIGLDSLSTLRMACMDEILHLDGRADQVPELSDYNIEGITINKMMASFCAVPNKIIYLIAHCDLIQDVTSKKVQNQINATKNVRSFLPRLMTDVWVSTAEIVGGETKYDLQTSPSREYPHAKNSFGLDPHVEVTLRKGNVPLERQGVGAFFK